jgi:hypothetical protein
MKKEIKISIRRLQSALTSSAYKLPIFVRFQTSDKYITVGVQSVSIADGSVNIEAEDGCRIVDLQSLIAVVAFQDAAGKPVFLKDFESESTLVADNAREIEILTESLNREIREWQGLVLDEARIEKGAQHSPSARMILNDIIDNQVEETLEVFESLQAA